MQDGFSHMEQSSEKTSELCSQVDCRSGQDGVKGQDERQRTAPLTPPRPLKENPCQKSLDWSRRCHTRKLRPQFKPRFGCISEKCHSLRSIHSLVPDCFRSGSVHH